MMMQWPRFAVATSAVLLLSACESTGPLYEWGAFPTLQYQTLKRDGEDPQVQLAAMQEQAEQAKSNGLSLPPGFMAHKGLLLLKTGNANAARTMLNAEKAAFPESAPYINRLLKRINKPQRSANKPVEAS